MGFLEITLIFICVFKKVKPDVKLRGEEEGGINAVYLGSSGDGKDQGYAY